MPSQESVERAAQAWCDPRTARTIMDSDLAMVFAEFLDEKATPKEAIAALTKAIREDYSYAWSWHCNIAMCFVDEGGDPAAANRAASRFMKLLFDVDTQEPPRVQ